MSTLRDALGDLPDDVFFDLLESDEAYLLVLDVPGVSAETLDLVVENGRISIEARREKALPDDYRYVEENRSLFFEANLPLPNDATESDAQATVTHGVLELHLPKRGVEERTIDIDVVDESESETQDETEARVDTTADGDDHDHDHEPTDSDRHD